MVYGLLGKTLSHSYSPELHKMLGCRNYRLFEVLPENLEAFLREADFKGINVTVPYKKEVIKYLDELSDEAKEAGSVNVITNNDGKLIGFNTDAKGFEALLDFAKINVYGKKVLVLGSGGAAGAVLSVLKKRNAKEAITVSRSGEVNYENVISLHSDADIIVNATPVGMYPENGESPVSLEPFEKLSAVVDLIYNPDKTALVLQAEEKGICAVGGLYMLVAQAFLTRLILKGKPFSQGDIIKVYKILRLKMRNIVFIGMPGSGKSVIARRLAQLLGREFADIDRIIEEKEGLTVTEIFEKYGEDYFRNLETNYTAEYCKKSALVISAGGGVVVRANNKNILRQNSTVIYLIRDLKDLTLRNRPVSNSRPIEEIAAERIPLYKSWSDISFLNTGINSTIGEIIRFMRLKPVPRNKKSKAGEENNNENSHTERPES